MNFKNYYILLKNLNLYLFFIEINIWIERNLYIYIMKLRKLWGIVRFMNVICCMWSSCGNNDINFKMLLRKEEII